jgi:hypothetical protein
VCVRVRVSVREREIVDMVELAQDRDCQGLKC